MSRMIYLGNVAPKLYLPGQLGDEPVLAPDQTPFVTQTAIQVSENSSLLQAVYEIKNVWLIHSHEAAPTSITCTADVQILANILCQEFGNIPFNGVVA